MKFRIFLAPLQVYILYVGGLLACLGPFQVRSFEAQVGQRGKAKYRADNFMCRVGYIQTKSVLTWSQNIDCGEGRVKKPCVFHVGVEISRMLISPVVCPNHTVLGSYV